MRKSGYKETKEYNIFPYHTPSLDLARGQTSVKYSNDIILIPVRPLPRLGKGRNKNNL